MLTLHSCFLSTPTRNLFSWANLHPLGKANNYLFFHLTMFFCSSPLFILQKKNIASFFKSEHLTIANILFFYSSTKIINSGFNDHINQEWGSLIAIKWIRQFFSKFPSISLSPRHSSLLKKSPCLSLHLLTDDSVSRVRQECISCSTFSQMRLPKEALLVGVSF